MNKGDNGMIKHIVMWKVKGHAEGLDKPAILKRMKSDLEALKGAIPEIETIEAGINTVPSDAAADICLISVFRTWEDLDMYRDHPAHQEVVAFVKQVVTDRRVVDYVVN